MELHKYAGWGIAGLVISVGAMSSEMLWADDGSSPVAEMEASQSESNAGVGLRNAADPDRVGREGLYRAVSAMLIREADMVEEDEARQKSLQMEAPQGPTKAQKLMREGLDDVLDEEYEDAIPKLEAVIELEPTYLHVWSTLGWTYWKVDRKDDTIALWKRLLALDGDNAVPHMLLGNAYVGLGRLKDGEEHLKRSIELDPTIVEPRLVLSSVYRWTGRYQASIKLLRELLAESPDRLDIQNELALSLYHNGDYEEALPLLQQGVRADPDNRDLVTAHARCLLHTGNITEAELRARRLLQDGGVDLDLLLLLADAPRYKDTPADAIPFLEDIARNTDDPIIRREALRRLVELYVRVWEREPEKYPLDKAIAAAKDLVDLDPEFMPWRQALSELLLMDRHYMQAEEGFEDVIANGNTNCLRAYIGICESSQASKQFDKALDAFKKVSEIDPKDPYLYNLEARLEMSRAGIHKAYEAVDKLEAIGARGAVAVLLYRGLSSSDWSDSMSVRRFRLHMLALKQAGFTFITPNEIATYFAERKRPPDDLDDHRPDRVVAVTFDHADAKTLSLATKVAEDLDIRFAMHVSVGRIQDGDMGVAGWDALREYGETGHWEFGSMLYDAANLAVVTEDGILGTAQANRLWLEEFETYETPLEFSKRLRLEYRQSRDLLRKELGKEYVANFMAYPHGDYGQGERSNVPDGIFQNLNEAAVNYEVGFVQSRYGYAVHGANSLLYQRYAPELFDTGEDVVDHVLQFHPVFLARQLRAEIASLDGRLYRVRHNLKLLRRDAYPERPYDKLEAFVYGHLAMRFGIAMPEDESDRGAFDVEIEHPYIGADLSWFRDSLHRRNWNTTWKAGVNVTRSIKLEARAGYGEYRQRYDVNTAASDETPVLERYRVRMREKSVGGRIAYRHEPEEKTKSPISIQGGAEYHEFYGDAEFDRWLYGGELAIRPWLPIDMLILYRHEMIPSARSVADDVFYDLYGYNGLYLIRDWWEISNYFTYYDINDGNDRFHAGVSTMWELQEEVGFFLGLAYDYIDARHYKSDYWTPYRLNEWWIVAELRNNIHEFYYSVKVKVGMAKEDVRPEDDAEYRDLVARAELFQFDPGPAPDTDWVDVFSASAALRKNLGRHWQVHWEGVYNEAPDYHEYATLTGISLIF